VGQALRPWAEILLTGLLTGLADTLPSLLTRRFSRLL